MTRKKFVKQAMAHGLPRNMANRLAWYYNGNGWPYELALAHLLETIADFVSELCEVIEHAKATGAEIDEALAAAVYRTTWVRMAFQSLPHGGGGNE